MNDNHPVAEFPLDHRATDRTHETMLDVWKTIQTTHETIKESQRLLARIDLLISPLIE
jgi:hypothetical protein